MEWQRVGETTMKEISTKVVCDRCGKFVGLLQPHGNEPFAKMQWNVVSMHGYHIDICNECSSELLGFLEAKGANAMDVFVFVRDSEVI